MFAGLGRLVHRRRWISLVFCIIIAAVGGLWGLGVFAHFKQGGFEDPKASSTYASRYASYFGSTNPDILVLYRSDTLTVDDPEYMANVLETVSRLPKSQISQIATYWNDPDKLKPLVSNDRHSTFVTIKVVSGTDAERAAIYYKVKDSLQAPGLDTRIGGAIPLGVEFTEQTMADIVNAERITIIPLFVLLMMLFGAVVASALPIFVAMFSIAGGLAVLNAVTYVTGVSSFALEVVTMMGVGLAIDYSLFIISRFREELAAGRDRQTALSNTMATAGKTVAFSGITVTTALAGLLLFPQMFLRSIGLGGMAVVLVSMFGATVLLPAMLAILGHRIEWGRMPWRRRKLRRLRERAEAAETGDVADDGDTGENGDEHSFWYRLGHSVMRRPIPYFLAVVTILAVLFVPFLHVQFGNVDARVLPKDSVARGVVETVKRDFPGQSIEPIDVVISGQLIPKNWTPGKSKIPPYMEQFRKRLAALPSVTSANYTGISTDVGAVRISVTSRYDPNTRGAQQLVRTIRAMKVTNGSPLYVDVGGSTAAQMDLMHSLTKTLPLMSIVVGTMTFILLFAAFGSIFLPAKAIIMNVLSIGASFGAIVWGFQDGHMAGLLDFTPTGGVEATSMILVLAVIFGLSMDYEVFLLSRIREEWDRTGDNRLAVAKGMQSTGGIITSAAALFLIVIAGFALAGITVVKLIGVGMFVAVVVDATLVRSLLVPATMRFMGTANWWLPGPLKALHSHMDLRESHAAPDADEDHGVHVAADHGWEDVRDEDIERLEHRAHDQPFDVDAELDDHWGPGTGVEEDLDERPVVRADVVYRPSRRPRLPMEPPPVTADARQPSGQFAESAPQVSIPSRRQLKPHSGRQTIEHGSDQARPAPRPARLEPAIPRWEGPIRPETPQDPPRAREIMPNPDGTGWRWRTDDDDAS